MLVKENNIPHSGITAGRFIQESYTLGDEEYDLFILPKLKILKDVLSTDEIFKSPEDVYNFFSVLTDLYSTINSRLRCSILQRYQGTHLQPHLDGTFLRVITDIVIAKSPVETSTKLFIEDLYNILYRNRRTSVSQYGYIVGTPIKDYQIGTKGLELVIKPTDPSYMLDPKSNGIVGSELVILLQRIGIRTTLSVIEILIAIDLNLWFYTQKGKLDSYIKENPSTIWALE